MSDLEHRVSHLEQDVSSIREDVREIRKDIADVRQNMMQAITNLRVELHQSLNTRTKWMAGFMAGIAAVTLTIARFLLQAGRAATGLLGRLFQTRLYHLRPCRRRRLVPDAALPPASLQACPLAAYRTSCP